METASEQKAQPVLQGRLALVTGTGGLGFEVAQGLARQGASVIIAGRNPAKGEAAVTAVLSDNPGACVRFEPLDLASLASVRALGSKLREQRHALDILVNNAGVMSPPDLRLTEEGWELQFGVNYLAHFALTRELLPLLQASQGARVVSVTSIAQRFAKFDPDNLNSEKGYHPGKAYCVSKLLMAMFARELQRRSDAQGWGITSLAAHPGFAGTNLFETGGAFARFMSARVILPALGHSAHEGARALLHAASARDVLGGCQYGPTGFLQMKGAPGRCEFPITPEDAGNCKALWDQSERLLA